MATVNFYLIRRDKSERKTVQVKYYDKLADGDKTYFFRSLKLKVDPEQWKPTIDKETKREKWLVDEAPGSYQVNRQLGLLKDRLFEARKRLTVVDNYGFSTYPSIAQMLESFNTVLDQNASLENIVRQPKVEPEEPQTDIGITDLIQRYIDEGGRDGEMSLGTSRNYASAKDHVKAFERYSDRKLTLDQLSRNTFNDFKGYLLTSKDYGGAGLLNSTTKKYLGNVRDVMRNYELDYPEMNKGYFKGIYPAVDNQIVLALYEG